MTDAIPVHIYFVLDRSGSMSSIQADVIGGFNHFVAEQKAQPGKCRLTLVQFDTQEPHRVVHLPAPWRHPVARRRGLDDQQSPRARR